MLMPKTLQNEMISVCLPFIIIGSNTSREFEELIRSKTEDLSWKKSQLVVTCQVVTNPLRFGDYLLRFHLVSDWSQNNKHSRNFLWSRFFTGKTVSLLHMRIDRRPYM